MTTFSRYYYNKSRKKKINATKEESNRKEKILKYVIDYYLSHGEPVASKFLVMHCRFNVSPATIRNDFKELTNEGYLYKCHLASGRLPTDKALKNFIRTLLNNSEILTYWTNKWEQQLKQIESEALSDLLDIIADKSHSLVFYYNPEDGILEKHGLKYIFSPLVANRNTEDIIAVVAEAIDHLDEKLNKLDIPSQPLIFIGKDNPFIHNDNFSTLLAKSNKSDNIYGLLGLKFMPYDKHLGLLQALSDLI